MKYLVSKVCEWVYLDLECLYELSDNVHGYDKCCGVFCAKLAR